MDRHHARSMTTYRTNKKT